ncbi:hypothetical protein [Candidatus Symbiopectobacterium endolongispinus]|uniref:hypothetical protein n=1 Tax=Candidatus Symbiopectobacterium endolongispinus TaxID=2812664 RepID=UPI00207A4FA6|nr:hypothetical protein [Candidatus Symbiopectobacterium endolongispinus]MBT9428891.1 hypothetical protein [Candidatus Symbiopectobacterium endolongispinus]
MNNLEFIEKHVITELIKQGYDQSVARISADIAKEHYCRNTASAKGKMFVDCLHVAKVWAGKYQPQIKR